MKQLIIQTGCEPFTAASLPAMNGSSRGSLLEAIIRGCAYFDDTSIPVFIEKPDKNKNGDTDSGAVLYIVAVLVFYSTGIMPMIVKYLKRQKRELEEDKSLDDFFKSMPAYRKEREQNKVNTVAIHAFHALTSISHDDADDESVTSEETFRILGPTIHEQSGDCDESIDPETTEESVLGRTEINTEGTNANKSSTICTTV